MSRNQRKAKRKAKKKNSNNANENSLNGNVDKNQPKIDTTSLDFEDLGYSDIFGEDQQLPPFKDKLQFDAGNNLSTTEVNTHTEQSSGESSKPNTTKNSLSETSVSSKPESFQALKQKMLDEVGDVKAEYEHVADPAFMTSRKNDPRKPLQDEYMVARKRFSRAQTYHDQNLERAKIVERHISEAKESFLNKGYDKDMISDDNIKKIREKFEQAEKEHNEKVRRIKIASGENKAKKLKFNEKEVSIQIAKEMFEQAGDAEIAAVEYGRVKTSGDELTARYKKRLNVLSKYINSAQEKGESKIARVTEASMRGGSGSGLKGKAAIFGGVALGALSLVGVTNLVMSGGRQSNSNLYNPYQAMY